MLAFDIINIIFFVDPFIYIFLIYSLYHKSVSRITFNLCVKKGFDIKLVTYLFDVINFITKLEKNCSIDLFHCISALIVCKYVERKSFTNRPCTPLNTSCLDSISDQFPSSLNVLMYRAVAVISILGSLICEQKETVSHRFMYIR